MAGIFGLPLPNGLVPQVRIHRQTLDPCAYDLQAPVHTESLTEKRDELTIIHAQEPEGLEIRQKKRVPVAVSEQRVSHFLMGLALIGTMTGPLLKALGTLPRAVISGVFFIVGVSLVQNEFAPYFEGRPRS